MGVDIKKFSYDTKHNGACEVDVKGLVKGTTFTLRSKYFVPGDFQKADVKLGAIYKDRVTEFETDYNIISSVLSANAFYKYQNLALGCSGELVLSKEASLNPRKVIFGLSYIEPAYELSTKFEADKKIVNLLGFYQLDRTTSVGVRLAKGLESSSSDIPVDIAVKHVVGKGYVKAKADSRLHLGLFTEQAVAPWMKVNISADVDMKNVSDPNAHKFGLGCEAAF